MQSALSRARIGASVIVVGLVLAACGGSSSISADDLAIDEPFSFVPTVGNGAVYFTITNNSDVDDVMISASADGFDDVELHDVIMEDGLAQMVEVADGIPIPAGESVVLEPGGLHVMLLDAEQEFAAGDEIDVALTFEEAGELTITAEFRERGEDDPPPMGHDDMEGMDEMDEMDDMDDMDDMESDEG